MSLEKISDKKKILLVEDDDSMRRFLEIVLQRAGYDVVLAEDGLAAMEIAFDASIEAVVTDAVMPHLTGHDLCRILRQNEQMKDVPLIILSGLEPENSGNSPNSPADAYLLKSSNLSGELVDKLAEIFRKKFAVR